MENEAIWNVLSLITDPEVPVLSILDLGIVRDVQVFGEGKDRVLKVIITSTYSGCPAMNVISMGIRMAFSGRSFKEIIVEEQLTPAWTTDWMTAAGKQKLKEYGIAPPIKKTHVPLGLFEEEEVPCPRCSSHHTELSSQFGPTSCKALYRCLDCLEPFEYFKCH